MYGVIAVACTSCRAAPDQSCVRDRGTNDWAAAIVSCEAELERSKDLARAVDAAMAAYYLQRPREVVRLATLALDGPTAADAHGLVGAAQLALGDYQLAIQHLEIGAKLHATAGNARAEARDYHQLSGASYQLGHYQAALRAEAAARNAAERAQDDRMMVFLDIARADILRKLGDLAGAEVAIERALSGARVPSDRVTALLKRGALHLDQGHPSLARDPLTRALEAERAASQPRAPILQALHLNLSYVERKAGAFARALDEMEHAHAAGTDPMSYHLNRGLVYADMGRLNEASNDLAVAEAEKLDGTWAWWVPFQRALVAARLGDTATAMAKDRRAIEQVARLASNSGTFGPTVVASHREPYFHLLGLLAMQQRWPEVLDVIAAMDNQQMLDSRELATDPAPAGGSGTTPALPSAQPLVPGAGQRAAATWQSRLLEIVVPSGERIWRIDIRDGSASGTDVGDASALAELARRLETDPNDIDAGRELGRAMLPAQRLAPRSQLALLVIGPLAHAPLAGLRIGEARAIARYQLVRAIGLLPRPAVAVGNGAPIAIGDPSGDLAAAGAEARHVAARLGGTALIGHKATRAGFVRAAGARLVHIAAHTTQRRDGVTRETLELADGPVDAETIATLSPPPRLVVLASCGASAGRDDAGNGSLTNAFLQVGAEIVVGTRWSVDDAESAKFVDSFYAAGGDRDPVAALGAAQLVSTVSATTWAAFEVSVARPVR